MEIVSVFGIDIANIERLEYESAFTKPIGFNYLVTPNVQHFVALQNEGELKEYYQYASMRVCDSAILQMLCYFFLKRKVFLISGSDLTKILIEEVLPRNDSILIIGSKKELVVELAAKNDLTKVFHIEPSMGFIDRPGEVDEILAKANEVKPKFIFIALGFGYQEKLAYLLKKNCNFDCMAFCIGAGIDFITGRQKRAPVIYRKMKLEWFYRMVCNPRRMVGRYFFDMLALFRFITKFLRGSRQ